MRSRPKSIFFFPWEGVFTWADMVCAVAPSVGKVKVQAQGAPFGGAVCLDPSARPPVVVSHEVNMST